ncbi:MAG: stp [Mucilaginibacter sp.]|nr:stp [Mucilaginibacter sp.]
MADQFFGFTDAGKDRKDNEDTFIAQPTENSKFIIACVIDGVGGYSGGEIAASVTRKAILQRLDNPSGEIIPLLVDCFNRANEKIFEEKKQTNQHSRMACVATLVLADNENNQFYYAHVGDTRLYLLRDGSLVKISHDQSFVGYLEDSGRLTEHAAMNHPKRNEINKALGFVADLEKDDAYIETGQSPFLPGDMLLLCSDGLTDMVNKTEITDIITTTHTLEDKCRKLIDVANLHGGKDNITVVLVQNDKQASAHDATMPVSGQKHLDGSPVIEDHTLPLTTTHLQAASAGKSNRGLVAILTALMLIFAGTTIWLYIKKKDAILVPIQKPALATKATRNKQELKLQNAIDHIQGHTLIIADTAYKSPILISQALAIHQDSLLIKARGRMELKSDPLYKGAAFDLAAQCKNIVLDSLIISDFNVGILAFNATVLLKNTRFINCMATLQNSFTVPGEKYINGKISAAVFKADSLPVTNEKK